MFHFFTLILPIKYYCSVVLHYMPCMQLRWNCKNTFLASVMCSLSYNSYLSMPSSCQNVWLWYIHLCSSESKYTPIIKKKESQEHGVQLHLVYPMLMRLLRQLGTGWLVVIWRCWNPSNTMMVLITTDFHLGNSGMSSTRGGLMLCLPSNWEIQYIMVMHCWWMTLEGVSWKWVTRIPSYYYIH